VATGTPLQSGPNLESATTVSETPLRLTTGKDAASSSSNPQGLEASIASLSSNDAPEISLVTLKATGEMRYLGPSSGISFASYATTLARSSPVGQNPYNASSSVPDIRADITSKENELHVLSFEHCQILSQSFRIWVEPLYPILDPGILDSIVARCAALQSVDITNRQEKPEQEMEMIVFYLIMALGAINHENTIKQLRVQPQQTAFQDSSTSKRSSVHLYSKALEHIDFNAQSLTPSIPFIQILLLISIYNSYGPVTSSQWQLTGLAMRVILILC
jgi:hypothetical protein